MRGTIRARGKGRWQVQVYAGRTPDGREHRVARTIHGTKRDAERTLTRLITEVEAGRHHTDDPTVTQLAEQWYAARQADWSPGTARQYRHQLDRHILPTLGPMRARKVRPSDLDRLYAAMRADGLAPGTVRKTHTIASSIFTQAEKWDLVATNPARAATPPKLTAPPVDPPAAGDLARLLADMQKSHTDLACFVRLAVTTGCRRGELCALQWDDIDLDAHTLLVARALADGPSGLEVKGTKTGRAKAMALDAGTVSALRTHRAALVEHHLAVRAGAPLWVFPADRDPTRPVRPDVMTHRWGRLAATHGLTKVRLHDLRHFVASQMLAQGADIRTVAGRLGHANPATTLRIYAHLIPEADRAAADDLGALLDGTGK